MEHDMMKKRPKVVLSSLDAACLEALLETLSEDSFPGKAALEEELLRAEVVEPHEMPDDVVTMNSTVVFETAPGNRIFKKTLVYPGDVEKIENSISILAPVGSALLGLSVGDEMQWTVPGGRSTSVRIKEITYQPEHAGVYDR